MEEIIKPNSYLCFTFDELIVGDLLRADLVLSSVRHISAPASEPVYDVGVTDDHGTRQPIGKLVFLPRRGAWSWVGIGWIKRLP